VVNSNSISKSISIYPNPAKNNLFIESNYDLSKSFIAVYDILGKKMILDFENNTNKSNLVQLNVSAYNKGIYFVKITDEFNSNITYKIIVE